MAEVARSEVRVRGASGQLLHLAVDDVPPPDAASGLPPVVLVHGFASDRQVNWISPSWYRAFAEAGRRVIAFDARGHGASAKPYDPADYDEGMMAADIAFVMASLGVREADVVGYSMGGFLGMRLAHDMPQRVRRLVVAGVGETYFNTADPLAPRIAEGLLAPSLDQVSDPVARDFRKFADRKGTDLRPLAACMRRPRRIFSPAELRRISVPVLVICGEKDALTGSPVKLAQAFVKGEAVIVPNRDHMTAVGDLVTKREVVRFLSA
ncbi:MAG TPA: alpha/beta hydrolase [Micropepsaceae bacterium]|nr:alpha/beta hydrolase [Micropepsaceae bacterium]